MGETVEIRRFDNSAISNLFHDYVSGLEGKPRHTVAANLEVGIFEAYCAGAFQNNTRLRNGLYEKMMNVAIEYEESGFIAGFRTAVALLSSQEASENGQAIISSSAEEKSHQQAVNAQKQHKTEMAPSNYLKNPTPEANFVNDSEHITSIQIAEMFGTTNVKVVRRIESQILPFYSEDTKKHFKRVEGYNIQHRKCTFYRLDCTACLLYMKEMESKKGKYVNIAGGYAKMQELIERMFPAEKRVLPA